MMTICGSNLKNFLAKVSTVCGGAFVADLIHKPLATFYAAKKYSTFFAFKLTDLILHVQQENSAKPHPFANDVGGYAKNCFNAACMVLKPVKVFNSSSEEIRAIISPHTRQTRLSEFIDGYYEVVDPEKQGSLIFPGFCFTDLSKVVSPVGNVELELFAAGAEHTASTVLGPVACGASVDAMVEIVAKKMNVQGRIKKEAIQALLGYGTTAGVAFIVGVEIPFALAGFAAYKALLAIIKCACVRLHTAKLDDNFNK